MPRFQGHGPTLDKAADAAAEKATAAHAPGTYKVVAISIDAESRQYEVVLES